MVRACHLRLNDVSGAVDARAPDPSAHAQAALTLATALTRVCVLGFFLFGIFSPFVLVVIWSRLTFLVFGVSIAESLDS
jgi:hypothetical protein